MELGNMIFGHSQGEYKIVERLAFEEAIKPLFDMLKLDNYGYSESCETDETYASVNNELYAIRPYYWGDDEEICQYPNFEYKKTGLKIWWYKYPFRDSYSNQEISVKEFDKIIANMILYEIESWHA